MKRIALFLAAAAATLASCVKENTLAPEQTSDNLVTIKALATKTTLDGNAVLWEANDAINVVFNSLETQYVAEFTTEDAGESAAFTGTLDASVTPETCGETGYAVYPSTVAIESDGKIQFSIPQVQDGKITTGENLSYASVSLANLKANGADEVSFHNALSMLQITVPAGVKSVTIATNKLDFDPNYPAVALAGKAPFFYTEGELQINDGKWGNSGMETAPGSDIAETVVYKHKSVVLKNADDSELAAGVHYVQVFPGTHEGLTITVAGSDFSYTKVIDQSFTFVASKYHPLNITTIFDLGSTSYAASPFGGTVEIPVITTADAYEVVLPADATWLTETPSAKGAFRKDVVSLTAEANTTGAVRTATVKINEVDVVVSQKGYVSELLNEYVETYSMYGQPFTGTLKIEQTDDPSQGVYKVTICGQQMYADYSSNQLTIYDGKNSRTLTVSPDYKTISTSSLTLGYSTYSDYKAILPLGPAVLTAEEEALVGTYNETWNHPKHAPATNAMEISASEEASFGQLKVKFLVTGDGSAYTGYASLEESVLKVQIGGQSHAKLGTQWNPDVVLSLTVNSNGTLTMPTWKDGSYNDLSNYVATKVGTSEPDPETPGAGDEEDSSLNAFVGTWSESFDFQQYSWSPAATYTNASVKITIEDGKLLATNILLITPQYGTPSSGTYVGEVSADGLTVTFADKDMNTPSHMTLGPVSNFVLILSADGKTLSATSTCGGAVKNYVATKK